jgi:hypothetical protein
LQELLVQKGADVLIEEVFRYASGAGSSRTICGMADIDGNDEIFSPTITAYRGYKNQ